MIEIVCPSCKARYQVPDDSIGPEGRNVTCSNCSHKWRAYREAAAADAGAAAAPQAGIAREAGGEAESATERPAVTEPESAGARAATGETVSESTGPASTGAQDDGEAPPPGGREEQMDAIRRMLDDLKRSSENEPEPEPEPAPTKQTARAEPSPRRRVEEDDDLGDSGADPLKSRIAQLDKSGKPAERPSDYDAAKLRRMHERRARRLQRAKERKRKSGAFLTGFTLVAVVAAAFVGLYVMRPQIVASSPELEPAMNQYAVTVDRYRLALDEATANWRAWLEEKVGPLINGGAKQAGGQAQDNQAQDQQTQGQGESAGASTASQ